MDCVYVIQVHCIQKSDNCNSKISIEIMFYVGTYMFSINTLHI